MSNSRLREAIQTALSAAAAGAGAISLMGCGGVEPGIEGDPQFVSSNCDDNGTRQRLPGLTPAQPTQYMELRSSLGAADESTGTLCGGASDVARCEAAFADLSGPEFQLGQALQVPSQGQLAATQGDDALLVTSLAELVSFLAPIDTPEDAMLLAEVSGRNVSCDRGGARPKGTGFEVQTFTYQGCDGRTRVILGVAADGSIKTVDTEVEQEADPHCVVGRRPHGLCPAPRLGAGPGVGRFFAQSARLEAAAVLAFRRLRAELALHGAPKALLRSARRAEHDEVRHARLAGGLARAFGATPAPAHVESHPLRDLAGVALENVVEGCVRETYGVAVARFQAEHAASVEVRRAYAAIARDELRHAELSWRVAAWAEQRLSRTQRRGLTAARRRAVATLRTELSSEPSVELVQHAGLPRAAQAVSMFESLRDALWS